MTSKVEKNTRIYTSGASDLSQESLDAEKNSILLPDQILPPNLFILPMSNSVIFPTLMAPILITEPRFIRTVEEAIQRQRYLGLLLNQEGDASSKTQSQDLYPVGVVVRILKRLKMPDGSINLLVSSVKRFRADRFVSENPHLVAEVTYLKDQVEKGPELDALTRTVISDVKKLSEVNPFFSEEMRLAMINAPGPGVVADIVAFALSLPKPQAQEILETLSVKERFEKLLIHLKKERNLADLQKKISEDVNSKINTMQREFFLKEQLKAIKRELGMEEEGKTKTSRIFRERIEEAGMPENVKKEALEELEKFETISEQSPEYNVSRNWLEIVTSLPWSKESKDQLDLNRAEKILNEDHYGLEKVKERILEFLAVRTLREDLKKGKKEKELTPEQRAKGSIICLVGPPGVGKTSIGKSIARTLGREFYRFSLGGMRDEAEIKGHRRTYIGAMPGKVIQAIKRAGTKNPVILLDEIDKLGQSYQGDPASALLEVLDPEQNSGFLDHYLDVPFDLSQVVFIATANTHATIPGPLLDRMEVIEIPGYTIEEKEKIATRYVIPKVLKSIGLKNSQFKVQAETLRKLISDYSREPGLRSLQQLLEQMARKAAAKIVKSKNKKTISVAPKDLSQWVGPKRFFNEVLDRVTQPGVVTGLAWTAMGGDILFIEATDLPGSGQLKLTGKMGEVMTESAAIAWTYVKKKLIADWGLEPDHFKKRDFHLHIPAGAIPKDGPSAGVTMATALFSLVTGKKVQPRLAMTGELSLVGKVLPVGGIKEKILAAKRTGVRTIILPKENRRDIPEVPKYALKGIKLHFVDRIEDVFRLAIQGYDQKRVLKSAQKKLKSSPIVDVPKAAKRSSVSKSDSILSS